MKTDSKGCSTCQAGEEHYEHYTDWRGKKYIQYDYRNLQGELFSCVRTTIEACRLARDNWLKGKITCGG